MQVLTRHEVCLSSSATKRERWRGCSLCAAHHLGAMLGAWRCECRCRDHKKRSSEGVKRRHIYVQESSYRVEPSSRRSEQIRELRKLTNACKSITSMYMYWLSNYM